MLFAGNLIRHPCFDEMRAGGNGYRVVGQSDNTDRIMRDTFWVGVYPGMTYEMLRETADAIRQAVLLAYSVFANKAILIGNGCLIRRIKNR